MRRNNTQQYEMIVKQGGDSFLNVLLFDVSFLYETVISKAKSIEMF